MNRRSLVLAGLAALPAAALLAPVSAKPRRGASRQSAARRKQRGGLTASHARFRVVTRTFNRPGLITVPAGAPGTTEGPATPYPSILQVGGLRGGKIQDVNVRLNGFSHTFPPDVQVILVASNGRTSVVLMTAVGDDPVTTAVTNLTLIFDDQAAVFLPFQDQLVSGTFKPTTPGVAPSPETATLRAFNGLSPNGAWRLYVADNVGGDSGSIAGWALTIRARVPVPHRHRRRANQRRRPTRRAKP